MDLSLLLSDYTFRTVTLGSALLGLVAGTLGVLSVLRRQSLIGDVAAHAALPGIALAFLLTGERATLPLLIGGSVTGLLAALLTQALVRRTRLGTDAALGVSLSSFFGLGIALLTAIQGSGNAAQAGLEQFLFGQAAALTAADLGQFAVLGLLALAALALAHKELKVTLFDPQFAAVQGWPLGGLATLGTVLTILAIMTGLQTVGAVLMAAMLIAPAVAARQWAGSFGSMLALAGGFGALSGGLGAGISLLAADGLPTGAVTVLTATTLAVLSVLFAPKRGVLAAALRQRQARDRLRRKLVERPASASQAVKGGAS